MKEEAEQEEPEEEEKLEEQEQSRRSSPGAVRSIPVIFTMTPWQSGCK